MSSKVAATLPAVLILLAFHDFLHTGVQLVQARKHHLEVRNDVRPYIALSTFGFYINGHLDVKLSKLTISDEKDDELFGLSLDKSTIDQTNPYLDSHQNKCILEEPSAIEHSGPILFFLLDLKNQQVNVQCGPEWRNDHIYKDRSMFPMYRGKRHSFPKVSESTFLMQRRKRETAPVDEHDGSMEGAFDDDADSVEQPIAEDNQNMEMKAPPPAVANIKTKSLDVMPADPKANSALVASKSASPAVPAASVAAAQPPAPNEPASSALSSSTAKQNSQSQDNDMPLSAVNAPFSKMSTGHPQHHLCKDFTLPLQKTVINEQNVYNFSFSMLVASLPDEGLYNLYFHACPNYRTRKSVSFDVDIEENNNGNYLSAGEMPLPALYFMMSLLFFLSGLFWVFILRKSKNNVFKIHYIMAVLVFLKSLSLMFHAINYHFIEIRGEHVEAWAILYYITHLLKGAVLFITIVLIGTGWTFIKHILSDKDKKIFMIVIPLQVFANVAAIIIDESEESDIEFRTWRNLFTFVDLVCCGAILFPIVWSIRHLHEASATDGKAAINLRKLKLFRQFYIMIVCYIYFTRIIVYLLRMTVAFQYSWLDEMFHDMATYVFFVLTGYKFRPEPSHPYFSVPDDDSDEEVDVLIGTGLTEGLHRTKPQSRSLASTTTVIEGNDEERANLMAKRESSHEYD